MKEYRAIGLMSGTSFDGLDLAYCHFQKDTAWLADIIHATTIPYSEFWVSRISSMAGQNAMGLIKDHVDYGHYLGKTTAKFINQFDINPDFICSHGHTIFHQPDKGFTLQVGDGNAIAAETGLPVIYDFRSGDVALGGQGAPLVPVGDRLLFGEYDYCLNIGGISNLSYEENERRLAFDISPANMLLNYLALKTGRPFDKDGEVAESGMVNEALLSELNSLEYYHRIGAKTLGKEWFDENIIPIISKSQVPVADQLATAVEHIAFQVKRAVQDLPGKKMLLTGGGALNKFLISRMQTYLSMELIIPNEQLIQFKEALIFAFLGVLRWRGEVNCFASVTGAKKDSSSGVICQ